MERAILVGLITPEVTKKQACEYLEELAFLAKTAGAAPIKNFTQKLLRPDNKTFVGKGKIQQVKIYVEENKIDVIIFDDDLTEHVSEHLIFLLSRAVKVLRNTLTL